MRNPKVAFALWIVLCALATVSTGAQVAVVDYTERGQQIGQSGGQLRFAVQTSLPTFNPVISQLGIIEHFLHASLLEINPFDGRLQPGLAKAWEISEDGRALTFHLRVGLRWSDGEPFTGQDVLFTYRDLIFNPEVNSRMREVFRVQGQLPQVELLNLDTVRFTFPQPSWIALKGFAIQPILPRHRLADFVSALNPNVAPGAFEQAWGLSTAPDQIVGMGPFQLKRLEGQTLTLRKNPYYWKVDPQGQTLPYLDQLIVTVGADIQVLQSFLNGQHDLFIPQFFSVVPLEVVRPVPLDGSVRLIAAGPQLRFQFLALNFDVGDAELRALFRQAAFRKALSQAIDREAIVGKVKDGLAVPIFDLVHPDSFYHAAQTPTVPFDLPAAMHTLDELDIVDHDGDGTRELSSRRPLRFSLLVSSGSPDNVAAARLISENWKALGVNVSLEIVSNQEQNDRLIRQVDPLFGPDFEATLANLFLGDDPRELRSLLDPQGTLHFFHFSARRQPFEYETRLAQLFDQADRTFDPARRQRIWAEVQELLAEELPLIPILRERFVMLVRGEIGNIKLTSGLSGDGPLDLIELLFQLQR